MRISDWSSDVCSSDLRRRIGAVSRGRNQAYIALMLAIGLMVAAYGQQAGELALRARIGLQADRIVAGNFAQGSRQTIDKFFVALALHSRGKWMHIAELGPGDGDHLGGGIQLHGA